MTNLNKFDRALQAQIDEAKEAVKDQHRELIRITYEKIQEFSPIYSGYYAANHRISLNGDFPLLPKNRSGRQGAHTGKIKVTIGQELQKLSSEDLPENVTIGNAVDYAKFLEMPGGTSAVPAKTGNRPVYHNAREMAIEEFESRQRRRK